MLWIVRVGHPEAPRAKNGIMTEHLELTDVTAQSMVELRTTHL